MSVCPLLRSALILPVILFMMLVCSCDRRPDGVLSEGEMVDLLTDMTLAETFEQSAPARELPDSVRHRLGEGVMRQHGVTREEFDSTVSWYGRNLDLYQKLYAKVDKRLTARIRKESGGNIDLNADDIWRLSRHYMFVAQGDGRVLLFENTSDMIKGGETLEWTMVFNASPHVSLLLGVDYQDGTSAMIERTYRGDRKLKLILQTDSSRQVKRVFGTVEVDRNFLPAFADSIRLSKLPFDSTTYYNVLASQKRYFGPKRRPKMKSSEYTLPEFEEAPVEDNVQMKSMHNQLNQTNVSPGNAVFTPSVSSGSASRKPADKQMKRR